MATAMTNDTNPTGRRRTRTRSGCAQCVRVSRKCDEAKPRCGRCLRLGYACDYVPRLLWKPTQPGTVARRSRRRSRRRTSQDQDPGGSHAAGGGGGGVGVGVGEGVGEGESGGAGCNCGQPHAPDLAAGHRLLGWAVASDDHSVPAQLWLASRHYPQLRDGLVALVSGHKACCADSVLSRLGLAIAGMRQLAETYVWTQDPGVVISGSLLLTQASMRGGHAWTHQLPLILALVEQRCAARLIDRAASSHFLEVLGCLEMDAWILGRQTKAEHIWARFCLGRSGIESVTGLPRSLLDLISRVSRGDSVERELRQFLVQSTAESRVDNHHWPCYALAALLRGHNQIQRLEDASSLFQELLSRLSRVAELAAKTQDINSRCLLWPLVVLGQTATSHREAETVENLFRALFVASSSTTDQYSYDASILNILRETWRTDHGYGGGDESTGDLGARGAELGIW